jgi:HlyD family secretion protein
MGKKIFRQVALDRLASPEQLDQIMRVTTPKGWIALVAIGVALVVAGAWSVGGTIPEKVNGRGILIRSGGIFQVVAQSAGAVSDVGVDVGDRVVEGQVIARLAQPEVFTQIVRVRARTAQLHEDHQALVRFRVRSTQLRADYVAGQRASLEQSVAASGEILAALEQRIQSQEKLVEQGLFTRQQLLRTQAEFAQEKEKVRASRILVSQLDVTDLQARTDAEREVEESAARLADAEQELAQLEQRMRRATEITSPYSGDVLEVSTEQGALVQPGHSVVSISLRGQYVSGLEAVLFVPSLYGKRIRPGMEVHLAPSTVEPEEYGYLLARVTYVSDYPATAKAMMMLLKNEQLVSSLMGEDAPFEVRAELLPDAGTASRFRWTSSRGPDIQLQTGTPATGGVIVEKRRPIFKVLPQLYQIFGRLDARAERDGRSG